MKWQTEWQILAEYYNNDPLWDMSYPTNEYTDTSVQQQLTQYLED